MAKAAAKRKNAKEANLGFEASLWKAAPRDALLPKRISGELRAPDAERIVGRAV